MAKRLTATDKWTQNKWFRKLPSKYKLFWLYLCDNCDPVGVWEEDIEFASDLLKEDYITDELLEALDGKIKIIRNGKKWWVIDFCKFQYGELKESNVNNKPHLSYIKLLKSHSLWIDYTKTIHSDKEIDKEIDIEEEKEMEDLPSGFFKKAIPEKLRTKEFTEAWENWVVIKHQKNDALLPRQAKEQLKYLSGFSVETAVNLINTAITNGWKGIKYEGNNSPKKEQETKKQNFNSPIMKELYNI